MYLHLSGVCDLKLTFPLQDYENAANDTNQQWLASKGITLTNYYGTGHPPQFSVNYAHGVDNASAAYSSRMASNGSMPALIKSYD